MVQDDLQHGTELGACGDFLEHHSEAEPVVLVATVRGAYGPTCCRTGAQVYAWPP
jgi:hypothetical protein